MLSASDPFGSAPWAQLFDPDTNTFSSTTDPVDPRLDIWSGVALEDGGALFVGGWDRGTGPDEDSLYCESAPIASAEIFDARSGIFRQVAPMTTERDGASTTLLADGRVLVAGGLQVPRTKCGGGPKLIASAELYEPATRTFHPTGSMAAQRAGQAAVSLDNGRVLILGGNWWEEEGPRAEVYH